MFVINLKSITLLLLDPTFELLLLIQFLFLGHDVVHLWLLNVITSGPEGDHTQLTKSKLFDTLFLAEILFLQVIFNFIPDFFFVLIGTVFIVGYPLGGLTTLLEVVLEGFGDRHLIGYLVFVVRIQTSVNYLVIQNLVPDLHAVVLGLDFPLKILTLLNLLLFLVTDLDLNSLFSFLVDNL